MSSRSLFDEINEEKMRMLQEKFSSVWNDSSSDSEFALAASVYCIPDDMRFNEFGLYNYLWPFVDTLFEPSPLERRKELIKACALILSEIERLDFEGNGSILDDQVLNDI